MKNPPVLKGAATSWRLSVVAALALTASAPAATYYVDPAAGSMSNPGSSASPWSTLEAVFAAGKTFAAGDVINLRNGYHGAPTVTGTNSANVTIQPQSGHAPRLRKLTVSSASRWVITGLDINPLHAGATSYDTGTHVSIQSSASYITFSKNTVRSATSIAGWTEAQWPGRTGTGISVGAHHSTVADNWVENVKYGINVTRTGTDALVTGNTIRNFANDGIRALASYCKFEYNTVLNNFKIDDNHDDGFQSWSGNYDDIPIGGGTVYNVEVRGNIFMSHTDPDQPFKTTMQGIGLFDGMYENWVVENNLIVTDQWHGIAFYGAKNCRIVNNTVVENPINFTSNVPWITVVAHKNGTASTGNLVRNNLASTMSVSASVGTVDHNIASRQYTTLFNNYAAFDFSLKASAPAVGAGLTTSAPATDLDGFARSVPYDVGAFEYQPYYRFEAEEIESATATDPISVHTDAYATIERFDATATGDSITYSVPVPHPGTYTINVRVKRHTSRGIFQLAIDGANQGSVQDLYSTATGAAAYQIRSLGTKTFTSAGVKQFKFTVTGKHASSSGYNLAFDYIEVTR